MLHSMHMKKAPVAPQLKTNQINCSLAFAWLKGVT